MRNNRHKHLAFPFEKTEHRCLTRCAASSFTTDTFRTEVRDSSSSNSPVSNGLSFKDCWKIRSRISRKYEFTVFRFTPEIDAVAVAVRSSQKQRKTMSTFLELKRLYLIVLL
jgi:hypothetical protein